MPFFTERFSVPLFPQALDVKVAEYHTELSCFTWESVGLKVNLLRQLNDFSL